MGFVFLTLVRTPPRLQLNFLAFEPPVLWKMVSGIRGIPIIYIKCGLGCCLQRHKSLFYGTKVCTYKIK